MDYKFKLLKIHCAGCALALEQNINQIEGVEAEISFVTKILKLKITTNEPADTLTIVKETISKFDHSIEIVEYEDAEDISKKETQEKKINIIKIAVAFVILLLNCFMPIKWLKICIFVLDYALIGYKTVIKAFRNAINGKISDENFLMSIASIGAFCIGEYIEAIMVMLLYNVGEILDGIAVGKSRNEISKLLEIKQPYANLVDGETEMKVSLGEVSVGDIIRIKPGERVPLDCEIVEGVSYLDMSSLTGETKEQVVKQGDHILSGSINGDSMLLAKVEKLEAESIVSKILDLVEKATETKAKSEKFI